MPSRDQIQHVISLLQEICARNGMSDVFFIGGYPRSIAMGTGLDDVKDLDIASGTPEKASQLAGLAASEAGAQKYKLHHRTPAITIDIGGVEIDFQGATEHEDARQFLHMWGIDATPISMNVFDRDFTMNSLAIPIGSNNILDLTRRGMADIDKEMISSILPPDFVVPRDPLMITRGVRFAYKYNFTIEDGLWKAMKDNVAELERKISPERLAIESFVLSKYDAGDMLDELGLKYLHGPDMTEAGQRISGGQNE
jgi:tRNA nucleotidyltransferase/poly(A) polymerase